MHFYSQYGQDYILYQLFKDQKDGYFVEVGCVDGKHLSNTLIFEKMGWRGLLVEPHDDYVELIKKNRPNSIVCHCAASDKNKNKVTLYADTMCSLSTLNPLNEQELKNHDKKKSDFKEMTVKQKTLQSLFDEHDVKSVDIMSLDIEGHETEALLGMDFNKVKPRALLIEIKTRKQEKGITNILKPYGYIKSVRVGSDALFVTDRNMHKKIKNHVFNVSTTITKHPFVDGDLDRTVNREIDTRFYSKNNIIRTLRFRMSPLKRYLKSAT
ncbi:MAG: FkbM family methyltransferase [Candidatus Falkowbacteria bacterium]